MFRKCMSLLAGCGLIIACTNNDGKADAGDGSAETSVACMPPYGGPVMGAMDAHCKSDGGDMIQPTDPASCHPPPDAGMTMDDAGMDGMYGETMNGSEGDDDDCKYHLKWSSTDVCRGGDVTFTLTVTRKADGMPATGANPYTETVLPPAHLAGGNPTTKETMPGVYTIGPVRFDQPGKWYVRFHLYGDCEDTLDTSPHGHAAFYVSVP